jgi:hypothetical protein
MSTADQTPANSAPAEGVSNAIPGAASSLPSADRVSAFAAPTYDVYYPTDTWSEVLPGLWLGGTHGSDDLAYGTQGTGLGMPQTLVNKDHFDTVITLYAWARPADWFVKEMRLGILDSDLSDFDPSALKELVISAHTDWRAGKRVLIRCQAGINRSSLVMALLLIRDGMSARKAIDLMRKQRGMAVLANGHFVDWLTGQDVRKWRA